MPEFASSRSVRLLTNANATLQVSRLSVVLEQTNAYQPDGIRYLAIKLGFQNAGTDEIVVLSRLSRLIVGNEEIVRVQSNDELLNYPVSVGDEPERTADGLQGEDKIVVPAGGQAVTAWMVFAKLPRTRELPPMTLKLETSRGPVDLELSRIENDGISLQLERIGPSGRVGIARVTGDVNAINVSHFARLITGYAEQGVSRLVVSFEPRSTIGDELTEEWLVTAYEEENERFQFYPVWPGLINHVIFAKLPGLADESGELLASNEAEAVQKVTRDLMPRLDYATLLREMQAGHPLIRRAILLNAGDIIAGDDVQLVLGYLNSPDPAFSEPSIRRAAIKALRSAVSPQVIPILDGLVRTASPEDAVLALKSLSDSQLADAQELAILLASDTEIQDRIGLTPILRTIGGAHDERWFPLILKSFTHADPVVRDTALEQLLRLRKDHRLDFLRAAMVDSHESIRNRAFEAMLFERSTEELPLFEQETMNRVKAGRNDERTLLAVREIRDPAALPQLLKWIDEKPSEDLALITTYAEVGGAASLGDLVERYPQLSTDSKVYVLNMLFATNHPSARRLIEAGLLSEESAVYRVCKKKVVEWGDDEAVTALAAAIQESNPLNLPRAYELVEGLGQIGNQAALQALKTMETSFDGATRQLAQSGMTTLQLRSPVVYWLQAATAKANEDDFLGAIEILNLALDVDPDSGRVYNSLGFAQMGLARGLTGNEKDAIIKQAKVYFEKALALSPNDHNPLTGVAICLANEGQYETAIRMVDTPLLLTRFSDQSVYLYNAACVYGVSIDQLMKESETPERAIKIKKYQKQAMLFLNAAIEQGFGDARLLSIDPDLNSLRELPGFKKLPGRITRLNP